MNKDLQTLQPQILWQYFDEVLRIPRPSKKEEKIRAYLVNFAREHNLECHEDATGNVLIRKPATPGHEKRPGIILQSHMDMVCEKNGDSTHNFDTDPIEAYVDGDWVKAKGTTLGADNGMGVATQLAILASNDLEHGPLECLFTVDEETGLTGAFGLQQGFLQGKTLLNLDSEDDGQFFIGCAGGIDTVIKFPYRKELIDPKLQYFQIQVKGLAGGHSGDDINKGRGNAIQLLARLLYKLDEASPLRIASFNGGNLRNAIAREAVAMIGVKEEQAAGLAQEVARFKTLFTQEYKATEPALDVVLAEIPKPEILMKQEDGRALIYALNACPHGVLRMSDDIKDFVETSTNLASVATQDRFVLICTSQRSSVESAKHFAAQRVAACFKAIGAQTEHSEGYPGWKPNANSPILKLVLDTFRDLFHEEGKALAIHAGLECGLFSEKYPDMDMVSYGPTMRGVHSPDEKVQISTVERFWKLTVELLKRF